MRVEPQKIGRPKRTKKRVQQLNPDLIAISTQADCLGRWAAAQHERMKLSDWFFRWLPSLLGLRADVQTLHDTVLDLDQQEIRSQVYDAKRELYCLSDQSDRWAAWGGRRNPPGA